MKRKALRRTPFKPAKGKVWKKLGKVSKKMKGGLEKYGKAKKEYLSEHYICECCCESEATQIHHKAKRLGALLWDKTYFLACCMECHNKIESNPEWAVRNRYTLEFRTASQTGCSYE